MKVKKGIEVENENKTHGEAISSLKNQERDLQRQIDTLNQQMTLKNSELDRFKGKMETLQSYNSTLETEVADLRNKVAALNGQIHSGQTDTIKQEHAKNQQEIEIFDLKKQLQVLKEENKKQTADYAISQKELAEAQQKSQSLTL